MSIFARGIYDKYREKEEQFKVINQRKLNKILSATRDIISNLDKKDIAEMKMMSKPPEVLVVVMGAICLLFGGLKDKE